MSEMGYHLASRVESNLNRSTEVMLGGWGLKKEMLDLGWVKSKKTIKKFNYRLAKKSC